MIVFPMRNAVVLAKELASLDSLVGGRLVAGVGVGWNEVEFANLGVADRFHQRGAYLDETILLWRHLWSGDPSPFEGRFHRFSDFRFGLLPAQGGALPIVIGGRSPAAMRRTGRLGDGFHASSASPGQLAEWVPMIREAALAAGRPMPPLSGRVNVRPAGAPVGRYALTGTPAEMQAEIRAFEGLGVEEMAYGFGETDAERVVKAMEQFDRDVLGQL